MNGKLDSVNGHRFIDKSAGGHSPRQASKPFIAASRKEGPSLTMPGADKKKGSYRTRPVVLVDETGKVLREFSSQKEAAESLKVRETIAYIVF